MPMKCAQNIFSGTLFFDIKPCKYVKESSKKTGRIILGLGPIVAQNYTAWFFQTLQHDKAQSADKIHLSEISQKIVF